MTPQRIREIAALLIADAELRRAIVGDMQGRKAPLEAVTPIADAAASRMKAAHELQEYSFGLKGGLA